jgi:hypothetical protein
MPSENQDTVISPAVVRDHVLIYKDVPCVSYKSSLFKTRCRRQDGGYLRSGNSWNPFLRTHNTPALIDLRPDTVPYWS